MSTAGAVIGAIVGVSIGVFLIVAFFKSIVVVREREQIVLERCGRFKATLTPGMHCIVPFIDRAKRYNERYYLETATGQVQLIQKNGETRVMTQEQVLDLPKQACITRDNAAIQLDVLLSYKIVNPMTCLYSCDNLPLLMTKVLQAQVRAVAGSLEVDSLIEEVAMMDRVAGELGSVASRWGVSVSFVRFQRVDAGGLTDVLARKKNAELSNSSIVINARAHKQKAVIEAEGNRDKVIKEAEGEAQQTRSRARGEAKAITNAAQAEADAVREVARAIRRTGENPTRYLLALKYLDALRTIMTMPNTKVSFLPTAGSTVMSLAGLGVSPLLPTGAGAVL